MLDIRELWNYFMISKLVLIIFGLACADEVPITLQEIQIVNYTAFPTRIDFWSEIEDLKLSWVKCGDKKAQSEGSSFFCENLQPCTEYLITCEMQHENNATLNNTFSVKTTFFEHQDLLSKHTIVPNDDSIFILWDAVYPQCISRFSIDINSTDFSFHKNITDIVDAYLDVINLNPCQEYGIHFQVFDVRENLVKDDLLTATTSFSDPGKINSIETVKGENNTITVKWTSPKHKNCVEFYYLKWTKLQCILNKPEDCIWSQHNHTDPVKLAFTFQNLDGCTPYALIITPNGDQLTNDSVNHNFTSFEQTPGKVVGLKIEIIHPRNVTLSWKPPKDHSLCIMIYKAQLVGMGHDINKTTSDLNVTFTDLEPCAAYNVTVTPVTYSNNTGTPSTITFNMEDDTPSLVQSVVVRYYPKELSVLWQKPRDAKYCIRYYRITGWATHNPENGDYKFDNTTSDLRIPIKDLTPCMMYTIQIIAVTTSQLESPPYSLDAETLPMVSQAPREPQSNFVMKDSFEITTSGANDNNKCKILYAKFICKAEESSNARIKYAEETVLAGDLPPYRAVLKPLSPFTKYLCQAYVFNFAGWSTDSKALLSTGEYFPELPQSVSAVSTSNTSIFTTWKPPKFANGKILLYNVYIQTIGPKYKIPDHCTAIKWDNISLPIDGKLEHTFQDALPYVEYSIQVVAKNSYGLGMYSTPVTVVTHQWIPKPIEEFVVRSIDGPGLSDKYEASVHLSWKLPCRSNGVIKSFKGTFRGVREGHQIEEFSWEMFIKNPLLENKEQFDWRESNLKPEFNYTVQITAVIEDDLESDIRITNFVSPAGIPQRVNITGKGDVNAFAASNPTSSAVVSFPLKMFHSDMGGILYAALLLSQKDCQPDPLLQFDKIDSVNDWPVVPTWYEVQNQDCVSQYQTTPIRWDPLNDHRYKSISDGNVEFAIGVDDCVGKATYCNGPLKADTKYKLTIRLFTRSGYNDAATLEFKTDSLVKLYFILLLVVSCLLLAFMLGFIYLWVTKRIIWHRESLLGIDEQSGDVSAKNFMVHYEELSKYEKLQREFKELTVITNDLNLTNTASKSNESKNRYSNIFPYDKNRVILDCDSDGADYINASFINGYKHKKEFIATQGPKPESFTDFWKMILQHNVRIIVMVTQLREGDIIKCHQYYPQLSKEMRFGTNISVTCRKELQQDLYDRREMQVEHFGDGLVQKVVHYYFKKWPDHDVPADPNDLITFIRKIKCERIPNHSPIVVHCSAGVGRTGTFIGLDILMQRLKNEGKINIFETVKELRFQRMRMVQTIQQYQFLYSCAHHLVKKKFPSKSKNKTRDDEIQLHLNNQNNSASNQSFSPNDIESVT